MVINDPVQPAALVVDLNDLPPDANIFMDNDIPIIQHAPVWGFNLLFSHNLLSIIRIFRTLLIRMPLSPWKFSLTSLIIIFKWTRFFIQPVVPT
jgi:hypothetical protein